MELKPFSSLLLLQCMIVKIRKHRQTRVYCQCECGKKSEILWNENNAMSGMTSDSFSGGVRQHLFIQSYSVVDKMENVTLVAGAQL